MCKMAKIPMSWKFYFSLRLTIRFLIYMGLAPLRRERCRMIMRGMRDGFTGCRGRIGLKT